jgi:hypothetical protein
VDPELLTNRTIIPHGRAIPSSHDTQPHCHCATVSVLCMYCLRVCANMSKDRTKMKTNQPKEFLHEKM